MKVLKDLRMAFNLYHLDYGLQNRQDIKILKFSGFLECAYKLCKNSFVRFVMLWPVIKSTHTLIHIFANGSKTDPIKFEFVNLKKLKMGENIKPGCKKTVHNVITLYTVDSHI